MHFLNHIDPYFKLMGTNFISDSYLMSKKGKLKYRMSS